MELLVCAFITLAIVCMVHRHRVRLFDRESEFISQMVARGADVNIERFLAGMNGELQVKERLLRKMRTGIICGGMGIALYIRAALSKLAIIAPVQQETINFRLGAGTLLLLIGIAGFASYFKGRKLLAKEIEYEERMSGQTVTTATRNGKR